MLHKTITSLAHFFSFVFSPLLVPTYGVGLALSMSVLGFLPAHAQWVLLLTVFVATAVIPALVIGLLKWGGYVSDFGLNRREERGVPYGIVCLSYLACAWMFKSNGLPMWLAMFMCGGTLATLVSAVVNHWWKISAHMAALGGLVGLLLRIVANHQAIGPVLPVFMAVVLAAGLVGSSRVWLGRHTLGQVAAGTLNGFLCVYLMSAIQ